jgi:ribosomal protein L22
MSTPEDKTPEVDETIVEGTPEGAVDAEPTVEADAPADVEVTEAGATDEAVAAELEEEADEAAAETGEPQAEAAPKRAAKPKADKAEKAPPAKAEPKAKAAGSGDAEALPVVRAQAKYVRTSARKARLVCDHIRGKSVDEARAILAMTPRAVSEDWSKLLESAVANAEHNHELLGDDLRILQVTADEGPTLKRFRPRAQGRATRIRKRTSHLTILLTTKGS